MKMNKILKVTEGAVDFLNNLIWHDSVLYEITFVRRQSLDQVIFDIDLLDDWEKQISTNIELKFLDCYYVKSEMNWGIECMSEGEMIYSANADSEGEFIAKVLNKWKHTDLMIDKQSLAHFSLELASTSSKIDIVFKSFQIKSNGESKAHTAPPPLFPKKE